MRQSDVSRDLERFYDTDAHRYRDAQWSSTAPARSFFGATRNLLLAETGLHGNERVLEIGCGPGTWTKELRALVDNIDAVDLSQEMIAHARRYVPGDGVRYRHGEFLSLDFGGDRYDRIVSVRVLEYFTDPGAFLAKCFSLLRPGGRIVVVTKTPSFVWQRRAAFLRRLRFLWPQRAGEAANVPAEHGYDRIFWQRLIRPSALRAMALAAGFRRCRTSPVQARLPVVTGGLFELPLLSGRSADRYLAHSERLTAWCRRRGQAVNTVASALSESYALIAERAAT